MKLLLRSRWLWVALFFVMLVAGGMLFVGQRNNVMHRSLDKLSTVNSDERWSHPEMLRIRELGVKAIPPLRRVLKEKDNPTTRFLLWTKGKWPGVAKRFSRFPDLDKINERRWMACQILQTLGPTGRAAAPELIAILKSKDLPDLSTAALTLWAIGFDADICDQLDALLEQEVLSDSARFQIVRALGEVKPPSPRTLKALTTALADTSPYVQDRAAENLGLLGVRTPEAVSALKHLQSSSPNALVLLSSSAALWDLEKDSSVLATVFQVLEREITVFAYLGGRGSGGQGFSASEQLFWKGGSLFQRIQLSESERSKALGILESGCEKSDRIFTRMLLLPSMLELGFPREKCVEVCQTGLNQEVDYYRIQAARLLANVGEKYSLEGINLDTLIHDRDVGVRVYAAKAHWLKNRQAKAVVPVLLESLDRSKHQSYYYAEVQPTALTLLGEIGPEARATAEALEKIVHDPNLAIAKLASEAIRKIRR